MACFNGNEYGIKNHGDWGLKKRFNFYKSVAIIYKNGKCSFVCKNNNNHTLLKSPKVINHNCWEDAENQSVTHRCLKCKQNTKDEETDVIFVLFDEASLISLQVAVLGIALLKENLFLKKIYQIFEFHA